MQGHEHRRLDKAQPDAQGLLIGGKQCIDGLKLALGQLNPAQDDCAGGFERHDDVGAQSEDGVQVLGRGVPTVGQQEAVGRLLLGHAQHGPQILVLGVRAFRLGFLSFSIPNGFGFFDEFRCNE